MLYQFDLTINYLLKVAAKGNDYFRCRYAAVSNPFFPLFCYIRQLLTFGWDTTFGKIMRTTNAYGLLCGLLQMAGIPNASAQEPHSFAIVHQLQATVTIQQENMEMVLQSPQEIKRQQITVGEWGETAI